MGWIEMHTESDKNVQGTEKFEMQEGKQTAEFVGWFVRSNWRGSGEEDIPEPGRHVNGF